jgi:hypothetical protein
VPNSKARQRRRDAAVQPALPLDLSAIRARSAALQQSFKRNNGLKPERLLTA